ncbi:hypothetical protein ACJIZ3_019182 [Penstemon smallii]|uniref:XIAP-associated factor 1 n=1 Tax=Penstemon smallii TaxID=265156 RepID=A0ABD3T1D4_9LAMI
MAVPSDDQITSICSHCDRAVPSSNLDLHFAHCSRNLEKCKVCGDMVPKKLAEEHFLNTHAQTMERNVLDDHLGEKCTQRIVTCKYCEFPLPEIDLLDHEEVCGNRTELCHLCSKYIRLNERQSHESSLCFNNLTAESSRSNMARLHAERRDPRSDTTRQAPRQFFSPRQLLFTISVTGIAVLLGSYFLQTKTDH